MGVVKVGGRCSFFCGGFDGKQRETGRMFLMIYAFAQARVRSGAFAGVLCK